MAIDRAAVALWRVLRPHLPPRPTVLEIGEANWYGDVPTVDVPELADVPDLATADLWEKARIFYKSVLDPARIDAVDLQGTRTARRFDLNRPLPMPASVRYDIVINTGTTEHVFDQRQVFETIHDRTKPGGLMVHAFPVGGCKDHGFYLYSPCLLRDLAAANGYETLAEVRHQSGADEILHLAWRRRGAGPFRVPQQNGYAGVQGGKGVGAKSGLRFPGGENDVIDQAAILMELESLEAQRLETQATLNQILGAEKALRHMLTKGAQAEQRTRAALVADDVPVNGEEVKAEG